MSQIEERLELIGLDPATRAVLRDHAPLVAAALPLVLENFYREILEMPRLKRFFLNDASVAHAKAAQLRHWEIILRGEFDDVYMSSSMRIGQAHHRIGLAQAAQEAIPAGCVDARGPARHGSGAHGLYLAIIG
jgi:hypothetical protein